MKKMMSALMISSLLVFLTSCGATKIIEGELYVTAMGLDFKEGKYKLYIQGMNFGNIAKQEGAKIEELPPLIGEVEGETIQSALSILEQNTAMPINLGHTATMLLSKSVIKKKMEDVIELVGQTPLLRYNMLLFGTDEDMKDLFQSQSFFNFSPLYTIIHRPDKIIGKSYTLPVLRFHQLVSKFERPVGTIIIPSLKMNDNYFTEGTDKKVAMINGEYFISGKKYQGWLSKDDLAGLKWITKEGTHTITILLSQKNLTVSLKKMKTSISVVSGPTPSYRINVKGNATLLSNVENKSTRNLEKELNKLVKDEILSTIKKGDEIQADVFNISEKAYRYYLSRWDVPTIKSFNEKAVADIQVKIHIVEAGGYKE